jgi:membrane-bound lytic murein transglycosylase B
MRLRGVPALVVAAGAVLACGVNVAAALAPSEQPQARVPYVDPFAEAPRPGAAAAPDVAVQAVAEPAREQPLPAAAPDQPAGTAVEAVVTQPERARADDASVASVAAATGIPVRALQAYADAALEIGDEDPSCRLGWNTIAAIGWIESGHGTHGGAVLGADGRPSVPIVGPALDGAGFAAIRSTDRTQAWHGDATWDHAVGPMQFIPSTWARWGADGDGDGTADPQDLDDAALAAAQYLCAGSRDLSTWDGWHAAVLSYNHDESYVQKVLARATSYAAAARR